MYLRKIGKEEFIDRYREAVKQRQIRRAKEYNAYRRYLVYLWQKAGRYD